MNIHITDEGIEKLDDGFLTADCRCGWHLHPVPDLETAVDALMEHAANEAYIAATKEHE